MKKIPEKTIESLKTWLIVLLLISAVLLIGEMPFFTPMLGGKTLSSRLEAKRPGELLPIFNEVESARAEAAALPYFYALTFNAGDHYGLKYTESDSFYASFAILIGEALGSASAPEEIGEQQWRESLNSPGIFVDYLYSIPLGCIAHWLGVECDSSLSSFQVRRMSISVSDDAVIFSFAEDESGLFYSAPTGVSPTSLHQYLQQYLPNNAHFAFEMGNTYSKADAYSLILEETPAISSVAAAPFSEADINRAVSAFSITPDSESQFTESDGTRVYVESDCTVRITEDGWLYFRESGSSPLTLDDPHSYTRYNAIEYAYSLVKSALGTSAGNADIYISGLVESEDELTVHFGCSINSVPILQTSGYTCSVTIKNGAVTRAWLLLRSYKLQEETVSILPETQSAVLADDGREILLSYVDSGSEVSVKWVLA